ncbi:ragulator complex protein LAMTOR4 homolog [Bombyx mandarina]|uniref:Late endosomal/lysosomal adaptor and MAPK and MTOR activator 4 n=1 Tax=Bombyx mandarina TaxID=7092 RepID=A0A6J2KCS0_BOMMA|nr:ragulator complex protein LAMTOR4 homolog [Bombyx mandarina]
MAVLAIFSLPIQLDKTNKEIQEIEVGAIMDKIPDQIGYLVLTEDGAVLESGGELENDERIATIITDLITLSNEVDSVAFGPSENFKKISITFDDHWYIICLSNKKISVVKRNIHTPLRESNEINV